MFTFPTEPYVPVACDAELDQRQSIGIEEFAELLSCANDEISLAALVWGEVEGTDVGGVGGGNDALRRLRLDVETYRCHKTLLLSKTYDVDSISFTADDLEALVQPVRLEPCVTQRHCVQSMDGTLPSLRRVVRDGRALDVSEVPNFLLGHCGRFALYVVFPGAVAKNADGTKYINFTDFDFRSRFYDRIVRPSIRATLPPELCRELPVNMQAGSSSRTKRRGHFTTGATEVSCTDAIWIFRHARQLVEHHAELKLEFGGYFFYAVAKNLKICARVAEEDGSCLNEELNLEALARTASPELDWDHLDPEAVWVDVGLTLTELPGQGGGGVGGAGTGGVLIWSRHAAIGFLRGLGFRDREQRKHPFCLTGELGGAAARRKGDRNDGAGGHGGFRLADGSAAPAAAQLYMRAKNVLFGVGGVGATSFGRHDVKTGSREYRDCVDDMLAAWAGAEAEGAAEEISYGARIEWRIPATALRWAGPQLKEWDQQCAVKAGALFRIPAKAVFRLCTAVVKSARELAAMVRLAQRPREGLECLLRLRRLFRDGADADKVDSSPPNETELERWAQYVVLVTKGMVSAPDDRETNHVQKELGLRSAVSQSGFPFVGGGKAKTEGKAKTGNKTVRKQAVAAGGQAAVIKTTGGKAPVVPAAIGAAAAGYTRAKFASNPGSSRKRDHSPVSSSSQSRQQRRPHSHNTS
ncbi:hypothetical protein HK405_011631 [Cladochytrium tenue]|nr:hypothetical protein HK405_011631 [Cladochytrium tenue]